MATNNTLEIVGFKYEATVKQGINLDNGDFTSPSSKTWEGKRKRNSDIDEEICNELNITPKKVKAFGPIVINQLSKSLNNEQSQVYYSTWFNQFPTVRLKMVTEDPISNSSHDNERINACISQRTELIQTVTPTVIKDLKECEIKLERFDESVQNDESEQIKDLKECEIKLERFDQPVQNNESEQIKDIALAKSPETASFQPVVILNPLDVEKEKFRKNKLQALTELLGPQRFFKPVVRLKLLDENDIKRLKRSLLTNVTTKLTIISSMNPVCRLHNIMDIIMRKNISANWLIRGLPENTVKRGPGRPRKVTSYPALDVVSKLVVQKVKRGRGRGRPRKIKIEEIKESNDEKMEYDAPPPNSEKQEINSEALSTATEKIKEISQPTILLHQLDLEKEMHQHRKTENDPSPQKVHKTILRRKRRRDLSPKEKTEKTEILHKRDACTSISIKMARKLVKTAKRSKAEGKEIETSKKSIKSTISDVSPRQTIRKMRCGKCENCMRPDCGTCVFCRDKTKFGGPNVQKQCCNNRRCLFRERNILKSQLQKPPVPTFKLTPKLEKLMKSGEPFLQDRPCWKLPLKKDQCRQCASDLKYGVCDEILCRFYLFRRLAFREDDLLTPIEFADAHKTTNDDVELFLPKPDKSGKLDLDTSLYILQHVADHFCSLAVQEKCIRDRFKSKVVLKRAIQGVREMCDVCDTTIFNLHFSCEKCGFGVCIDCYDGNELLWMACIDKESHVKEKLMMTQIIPGDILWEINDLVHKKCDENGIAMDCGCESEKNKGNKENIGSEQALMEKTHLHNGKQNAPSLETDRTSGENANDRTPLSTLTTIINTFIGHIFNGKTTDAKRQEHFLTKYPATTNRKKGHSSRIYTLMESRSLFPGVPHSWLCEGHLLWLREPHHSKNLCLFQEVWKWGQPILVSNVHKLLNNDLWSPKAFSRDFGQQKNDLIDTVSGVVLCNELMMHFWDGFEDPEKRLKDKKNQPRLLKLKDWPPGDDFSEILPSRFDDLMKALPLPEYTRRDGKLNLTARLPHYCVPPDLGPKLYIAYGSTQYPSQGTTNLHLDMSDAVNVMVYAGILKDGNEEQRIKEAYHAVLEAGCDTQTCKRVRQKSVQLGAIWHIFRARDAPKIRTLLNNLALEKGEEPEEKSDPIHDQKWYLDSSLRQRLSSEFGVNGFAIAQCVGDAVFIPAGAPHQVRNLHSCIKVAEDFVTPENIGHCIKLTQEFRHLSNSHTNHEDKLQIKNIAYHSIKDSLSVILK